MSIRYRIPEFFLKRQHRPTRQSVKMAFGLYSLIEAVILCLNAVCVLHEERFLAKSR